MLPTNVPGTALDAEGVCNVCREYESHKSEYDAYFKSEDDLRQLIAPTRHATGNEFDCLLLYSGGKDSTYALYRLVDWG